MIGLPMAPVLMLVLLVLAGTAPAGPTALYASLRDRIDLFVENERQAYLPFNAAAALVVVGLLALAWWAARACRWRWSLGLLVIAIATVLALHATGLNAAILFAFAPDLALVLAAALALLCMPSALLVWPWARARPGRSSAGTRQRPP